jgi:hypothetical protein
MEVTQPDSNSYCTASLLKICFSLNLPKSTSTCKISIKQSKRKISERAFKIEITKNLYGLKITVKMKKTK